MEVSSGARVGLELLVLPPLRLAEAMLDAVTPFSPQLCRLFSDEVGAVERSRRKSTQLLAGSHRSWKLLGVCHPSRLLSDEDI